MERVAGAAPGSRNHALNRETFALSRLVFSGGLEVGALATAMASAALAAGLTQREVQATVASALRAGELRYA